MYTTAEPIGDWLIIVIEDNEESVFENAPCEDSARARAEYWRSFFSAELGYTIKVRRKV